MSHDVKSPVVSLQAVLDLVGMDEIKQEEFPAIIQELSQSTHHVSMLLENILGWVSVQLKGSEFLEEEKIPLREAADEVINLYTPIASSKNLRMINYIPGFVRVKTHKNSLSLILRNLISNAIKFSFTDQVMEVFAKEEDGFIKISICDHGSGMTDEEIGKLFRPDKLFSKAGTQQEKGTGLGLM